jgi:hypothetical protein
MANPQADIACLKESLRAFAASARLAHVRALKRFAEDSLTRAKELVPAYTGHLMQSGATSSVVRTSKGPSISIGFSSHAEPGGLIPPSKRSDQETEVIQKGGTAGGMFVDVAIGVHESQAFTGGPAGVPHGPFYMGRSAADSNPGGHRGTFDEGHGPGWAPSDGERGGQYLRRVQMNTEENQARLAAIVKDEASTKKIGREMGGSR